jgi:hypothetical protein
VDSSSSPGGEVQPDGRPAEVALHLLEEILAEVIGGEVLPGGEAFVTSAELAERVVVVLQRAG